MEKRWITFVFQRIFVDTPDTDPDSGIRVLSGGDLSHRNEHRQRETGAAPEFSEGKRGGDHVVLCHVCSGNRKYPVAVHSSAGGRRRGGDPVLARKMGVECQSVAKATRRRRRILRAGFFFKRYQPKTDSLESWPYVCSLDSCPSGGPDERGH